MAHRWHYVDWEERKKRLDPQKVLDDAGVSEGDVMIDLGSGNGFFSIPAARKVGGKGKIYALDANPEAIEFLGRKASEVGIDNIVVKTAPAEESTLCDGCGDVVFFAEVLHDFHDPIRVLENAHRMLKHGGRVVDLDWKKEHAEMGPPYNIRFSEEMVVELLQGAGFVIDSVEEFDPHHYIVKGHRD